MEIEVVMSKIIVIGCPGSGKSTLTAKMENILNYPVMHLDKVYHIDNNTRISTEQLIQKVDQFANAYNDWIIDGNYITTMEQRIVLADTIVLLDIDTQTCVENAIARSKKQRQPDMAVGFDVSQISQEFLDYIAKFKQSTLPKILNLFEKYKNSKNIIILKTYDEIEQYVAGLKSQKEVSE